jgi:hypothetical protein
MARTIVALYDDLMMAQHVVNDLTSAGIPRERISLVANDANGEYADYLRSYHPGEHVGPGEGTVFGASVGALTGLLVSLGSLAIPGVGPVVVAGPLVAGLTGAVTGAVAGGATGGIVGSLLAMDIPEKEARRYAEGVRRGGTLVSVQAASEEVPKVEEILSRHNPVDIERRATYWRESGWKNFDERANPYPAEDITRDREAYRNYESTAPTQQSVSGENYRVRSYENEDRSARV